MSSPSPSVPVEWMSLYIPILPPDLSIDGVRLDTESAFMYYFDNFLPIGKVSHVEFIMQPTMSPDETITSLVVHFSEWFYQTGAFQDVRTAMETVGCLLLQGGVGKNGWRAFVSNSDPTVKRHISIEINNMPHNKN